MRSVFSGTPYVFCLLIAIGVAGRLLGWEAWAGFWGRVRCLFIIVAAGATLFFYLFDGEWQNQTDFRDYCYLLLLDNPYLCIGIPIVVMVYLIYALRRSRIADTCSTFLGSLACILYGSSWWVHNELTYLFWPESGLVIGISASIVLLIFTVMETAAATRQTLWRTIAALIAARLPKPPSEPTCQTCGYALIGLPAPRCPECGTPFDTARLSVYQGMASNHPPDALVHDFDMEYEDPSPAARRKIARSCRAALIPFNLIVAVWALIPLSTYSGPCTIFPTCRINEEGHLEKPFDEFDRSTDVIVQSLIAGFAASICLSTTFGAAGKLLGWTGWSRLWSLVRCVILLAAAGGVLAVYLLDSASHSPPTYLPYYQFLTNCRVGLIIPVASGIIIYLLLACRNPAGADFCSMFAGSLLCFAIGVLWWVDRPSSEAYPRYGLMLSFVACAGLMYCSVLETSAVTGLPLWRTIVGLLTARLPRSIGRASPAADYSRESPRLPRHDGV